MWNAPEDDGVSSMWMWFQYKYNNADEMRTIIMEWSYIYGYVSFGFGLLFLLGLIGFTWVTLCKIHSHPVSF
jgi:hypothetical protein